MGNQLLNETKHKYAQEEGYHDWQQLLQRTATYPSVRDEHVNEIATRYAAEQVRELRDAFEKEMVDYHNWVRVDINWLKRFREKDLLSKTPAI